MKTLYSMPKITYFIFFLLGCILLFSLYHIYFAQKIIPGVSVGDVELGGMTYPQAHAAVTSKVESADKVLKIHADGQSFEFPLKNIGLTYNTKATVLRAFEVGRTGNIVIDTKDKLAGLVKPLRIKARYQVDNNELGNVFSTVRGELNVTPVSAEYKFDDAHALYITDSHDGKLLDDQELYDQVVSSIESIDFSIKQIAVDTVSPTVTTADLEFLLPEATNLLTTNFEITYEDQSWVLEPAELVNFITSSRENNDQPQLALNKAAFGAFIEILSSEIDTLPRGKVRATRGNQVTGFEVTQVGVQLDAPKFESDFKKTFFGRGKRGDTVTVTVNEIGTNQDNQKYGIFSLLGEGKSLYTNSAPGREHNLKLSSQRIDGVLVPPGEVFSFNKEVGTISQATGYMPAYIIAGNRTVLGDGGGTCQTSTTLFRAVLDAGLPIVTRHPHAFRILYYELESDIGLDASVFQPGLDFEFLNDTPNHILVQMYLDDPNDVLGFKIYGTPDGREVAITDSVTTNPVGAPPALYQDDPSLPKGTIKQVEYATGGITASFSRTVTKDNEVLHEDTFTTVYQPWRAVYLVGTKT